MSVLKVESNIHTGSFFNWERHRFGKNRGFLLCFDVRFRILSNASAAVFFFLFFFSSQLSLECLLSSAENYSRPPHLFYCLTMSRSLQGNGRESLWLGRLITVYSLIRNRAVKQMVPWFISESGLICRKCLNSFSFSASEAIQII